MKRITILSLVVMGLLILALVALLVVRSLSPQCPCWIPVGSQGEQIADILELGEERRSAFVALYEEYRGESKPEPRMKRAAKICKLSDEEIERNIKRTFARSRRAIRVKEGYYDRFREILSPREIAVMYEVERRTHDRFVDEYQRRARRDARAPRRQ